jgi:hypothetical protein
VLADNLGVVFRSVAAAERQLRRFDSAAREGRLMRGTLGRHQFAGDRNEQYCSESRRRTA